MSKKSKLFLVFSLIGLCCVAAVIFRFSSQTAPVSASLSKAVSHRAAIVLNRLLHLNFDADRVMRMGMYLEYTIRKLAHFTEYACMGVVGYFIVNVFNKVKWQAYLITLLIVTMFASLDEFNQLFVLGRGGAVKDIFIDSAGGLTGICISNFIVDIVESLMPKKKKRKRREGRYDL